MKTRRPIKTSYNKSLKIEASIVGRSFESGEISDGDWVTFTRDHEDPDASHAIRVDSEATGEAVGYIEKHLSAILSPYIDRKRIRLTGQVCHGSQDRVTPVTIFIAGEDEDVETVMKEVNAKTGEQSENDDSGSESLTQTIEERNQRNDINKLQHDVEEIKRNLAQISDLQAAISSIHSMVASLRTGQLQNPQVQSAQQQSSQDLTQV